MCLFPGSACARASPRGHPFFLDGFISGFPPLRSSIEASPLRFLQGISDLSARHRSVNFWLTGHYFLEAILKTSREVPLVCSAEYSPRSIRVICIFRNPGPHLDQLSRFGDGISTAKELEGGSGIRSRLNSLARCSLLFRRLHSSTAVASKLSDLCFVFAWASCWAWKASCQKLLAESVLVPNSV
jgi:hypothetical protein